MSAVGLDVPVLLIAFNRPDVTAVVFEAIRAAAPTRLYVAADGPRAGRGEEERCAATRAIATSVDWDCTVQTLFQEANLGCRRGVQAALDWFFQHEEAGIVLEDDCLPDPTFFPFAAELLERFKDDNRVMMVSGHYYAGDAFEPTTSYTFSRHTHIWGWASWRRAWREYDAELAGWPKRRASGWLEQVLGGDRAAVVHWTDVFDRMHAGQIDTWDYAWTYSVWQAGGLSAQTTVNLVSNIGFGPEATHTADAGAWQSRLPTTPATFPLNHPAETAADPDRDAWTEAHIFGGPPATWRRRIGRYLRVFR